MSAVQHPLELTVPSALVALWLFEFVGKLVQSSDSANPALRLTFPLGAVLSTVLLPAVEDE